MKMEVATGFVSSSSVNSELLASVGPVTSVWGWEEEGGRFSSGRISVASVWPFSCDKRAKSCSSFCGSQWNQTTIFSIYALLFPFQCFLSFNHVSYYYIYILYSNKNIYIFFLLLTCFTYVKLCLLFSNTMLCRLCLWSVTSPAQVLAVSSSCWRSGGEAVGLALDGCG